MWAVIPIKQYLMTSRGMTFSSCLWKVEPFLVCSGVGVYFVYNTLPFGWKISPFVYHSTGLVVSTFFRSIRIPCSLYIDDRHNGQLQIPPNQGAYANLPNFDEHNLAAAKSAIQSTVSKTDTFGTGTSCPS